MNLRGLAKLLAGLAVVALSGCYEGWEYDEKDGGDNPTEPTPRPVPTVPPLFYILFEPFYLSDAGIDDTDCFPGGREEFRKAEWAERVASLTAALGPLAENFVVRAHRIAADDCESLAAIRGAAIAVRPWAPDPDPEDDPLDRKLVHLRAVFWEDDVEAEPPQVVLNTDWLAWDALKNAGRRAQSVTHFVLERASEGYFASWSAAVPATARVDGTPIDTVDPSDAGIAARSATIESDTAKVVQWLVSQP